LDYKQCGSWLTASDGPEVMGTGSLLMYMNILTADDSIKMAVTGITFQQITLFQGNAGGAVNIGSYRDGLTTGMSVDGLYAHRVLQKGAAFDGKGGLIVTRNGCTGSKIKDSWITNLFVPSLGGVFENGESATAGAWGPTSCTGSSRTASVATKIRAPSCPITPSQSSITRTSISRGGGTT